MLVAGSSTVNFVASYLAATYLPTQIGTSVSYGIYFAQLWAGILGVVFYNIVRIEDVDTGKRFHVRWHWIALLGLLALAWLNLALVMILALRFAIIRGSAVPFDMRSSWLAGLALLGFSAICAVAAKAWNLWQFYAVLTCAASLSIAFMTWRHDVWLPLPGRFFSVVRGKSGFIRRILQRSSLDAYIFVVSAVLLYVVMHTATHVIATDFVKIYSAMAIANLFVVVVEARVLNMNIGVTERIGWTTAGGMAGISFVAVFAWTTLLIKASVLAGVGAAGGAAFAVLSGNLLARIRRCATPRATVLLSLTGLLTMLLAFLPLLIVRVELEVALMAMFANTAIQFVIFYVADSRLQKEAAFR